MGNGRGSICTPDWIASSAIFSNLAAISSSTYSSPQVVQTRAGTSLITTVAPSCSSVTVTFPGAVSPYLQITHFIAFSSSNLSPTQRGSILAPRYSVPVAQLSLLILQTLPLRLLCGVYRFPVVTHHSKSFVFH